MNLALALGQNFVILIGAMIILWLISVRIRDVSFIDSFWAWGMAMLAGASLLQTENLGWLGWTIFGLTMTWGARLGTHLLLRWRHEGEDPRYTKIIGTAMKKKGWSFAKTALIKAWILQMPLLFMVCLPAQIGILLAGDQALNAIGIAGLLLATIGIIFETVGDAQLKAFKADPSNKGKVLNSGLWRYTRHPNYFGDFCAWWGIWLVATQVGWPAWIAIIGPVFLSFTLTKWSGAPMLEYALRKNRPDYVDYIEKTSGFFPMPPKI
ncbi:MAG: DUF1295 domain-containing protein [Parasphingorhabdus sp.]|uniref:DUF1295 domain-containing protein n=1 Tax=Parasphingorhabdus sp. TaxID=2709688 RepID=UPI003299E271